MSSSVPGWESSGADHGEREIFLDAKAVVAAGRAAHQLAGRVDERDAALEDTDTGLRALGRSLVCAWPAGPQILQ